MSRSAAAGLPRSLHERRRRQAPTQQGEVTPGGCVAARLRRFGDRAQAPTQPPGSPGSYVAAGLVPAAWAGGQRAERRRQAPTQQGEVTPGGCVAARLRRFGDRAQAPTQPPGSPGSYVAAGLVPAAWAGGQRAERRRQAPTQPPARRTRPTSQTSGDATRRSHAWPVRRSGSAALLRAIMTPLGTADQSDARADRKREAPCYDVGEQRRCGPDHVLRSTVCIPLCCSHESVRELARSSAGKPLSRREERAA